MENRGKNKLLRLGVSFVLFVCGVLTLQMEPSALRTAILVAIFVGLGAIAVYLTIKIMKK